MTPIFSNNSVATEDEIKNFLLNGEEVVVDSQSFTTTYYIIDDRILVYDQVPTKINVQLAGKQMRSVMKTLNQLRENDD